MIGIYNADSSFFNIKSPSIFEISNKVLNADIINLTITEEIYKMSSGSLTLYDPNQIYSTLFKLGVVLEIEWGYKKLENPLINIFVNKENPNEIGGILSRKGTKFLVMSPSGSGDEKGYSEFKCNLYSTEYIKTENKKVYKTGTKQTVVQEVMTRMGILTQTIVFSNGNDLVSDSKQIVQHENDFNFLQRLALQNKCVFKIGHTPLGLLHGLFVDIDQFHKTDFYKKILGSEVRGNVKTLNWKKGIPNVISYTWQNHAGESGTGDNIMIVPDGKGQYTFIKYQAEGDSIVAYKFVPERVTEEIKRRKIQSGFTGTVDFVKWALNQGNFNELVRKGFFIRYEQSTAPQGLGYTLNVQMLGDPHVVPPMLVSFGAGFPDILHNQSGFFIRKVIHTISKSGYRMVVDICDTLAYTGGQFIKEEFT